MCVESPVWCVCLCVCVYLLLLLLWRETAMSLSSRAMKDEFNLKALLLLKLLANRPLFCGEMVPEFTALAANEV